MVIISNIRRFVSQIKVYLLIGRKAPHGHLGDRIKGWLNLRKIGGSPIVKTSYLWFVLVPIAARTLENFPKHIYFEIFGQTASLSIGLPFRWKVLFYVSASFALGQAIYTIWCPEIIKAFKDYKDYKDYKERHSGIVDLNLFAGAMFSSALEGDPIAEFYFSNLLQTTAVESGGGPTKDRGAELLHKFKNLNSRNDLEYKQTVQEIRDFLPAFVSACQRSPLTSNDLFDTIRYFQSTKRFRYAVVSLICFVFGFILLAVLAYDSLISVLGLTGAGIFK